MVNNICLVQNCFLNNKTLKYTFHKSTIKDAILRNYFSNILNQLKEIFIKVDLPYQHLFKMNKVFGIYPGISYHWAQVTDSCRWVVLFT